MSIWLISTVQTTTLYSVFEQIVFCKTFDPYGHILHLVNGNQYVSIQFVYPLLSIKEVFLTKDRNPELVPLLCFMSNVWLFRIFDNFDIR